MKDRAYNVFEQVKFSGAVKECIDKIEDVDGWLSKHEAAIFALVDETQKTLDVHGYLAELGVWHGRGTILMHFLRRSNEDLYAIDIFDLRDSTHSHYNDPEILRRNLRKMGVDRPVSLVTVDTAETPGLLGERLPGSGCRLFHVDGGHEYRSVRHDMMFAASVLGEGGVLVCDDVFAKKFPGVTQALVEMLLANSDLAPFALSTKKAWITTRDKVHFFSEHILRRCRGSRFRRSEFMGQNVLIMP